MTLLHDILERFLNAVGCLVADETMENLPLPAQVGKTKVGGIDLSKPRMRRVAEALQALSTAPTGFTASELAEKVRALSGEAESAYGPRRVAYDLKKLRSKGMVRKIGASRRYEPELAALRAIAAPLVLREKVIRPLLAASQRPEPQIKANHPHRWITTTNICQRVCAISSPPWGLRRRIDNSFFIFSNKGLGFGDGNSDIAEP